MRQENLRGVEMNRREFLEKAIAAGSVVLAFGLSVAKAVVPRKFLRAKPLSEYPGRLKPLGNINSQSKWSG
jgi:hypothetical protein